jgi:carboxypeptidase Taq
MAAAPSPEELFTAAAGHARQVAVLASVEAVLGWDERTMMPTAAAPHRAEQAAALAALVHEARTDPAQRDRLAALAAGPLATSGTPEQQATIRLLARDAAKQARLPPRLVEELARVGVEAQQAWARARAERSWPVLEPWLRRMFALKREQAACQLPDEDPYDALLDDYEPGARWPDLAARFDRLRAGLVPLVRACVESRRRPDDAVLRRHYPLAAQQAFVREVAARIGFDFDRGRLDTTDHPFCSTLGPDDCRITTRWDERFLPTALYGVLHEAGHGLYEQGLPRDWHGLPPGEAASLGIHESQSRLWENLVGRSRPFWDWCFPRAREAFPAALADTDAGRFQEALLVVRPSPIRVEADEVTYNLHVMLRFDLERAVIHDALDVADLPHAWNERFTRDFGGPPADDAEGVLQDIHWSAGLVGYFPTYTLGNIYAAQLMAAARRRMPDLSHAFAAGRFGELLAWLRSEIHAAGRTLESDRLVERATGEPVSERWLLESLHERYGPAHGLAASPPRVPEENRGGTLPGR